MPTTSNCRISIRSRPRNGKPGRRATTVRSGQMLPASELLCEAAGIRAGLRVLDVATGTGNAALAAARRGCDASGSTSRHAARGGPGPRGRRGARGPIRQGDAEQLPFPDASFDAVLSVFGRCSRPTSTASPASCSASAGRAGGRDGELDSRARTLLRHRRRIRPPPAGIDSPLLWGTRERLDELFAEGAAELRTELRSITEHYASPAAFADFYCSTFGPIVAVLEGLDNGAAASLRSDLVGLGELHRAGRRRRGVVRVPRGGRSDVVVVDPLQVQPPGRGGLARLAARTAREQRLEVAALEHRADEDSTHVAQEADRLDRELELLAVLVPRRRRGRSARSAGGSSRSA